MERIPEEVIQAYQASESYQKLKTLRNESAEILRGYYTKYKNKLSYFKNEYAKKVDHERYGTGVDLPRGETMPGKYTRVNHWKYKTGRLVKEYVDPGYVYGYDKEDNLITSDSVNGEIRDREYIFWETPQVQLGLKYWGSYMDLTEITEAAYNEQGRIQKYLFGLMDVLDSEKVMELNMEKYEYKDDKAFVTFIHSLIGYDGEEDYITGQHVVLYMDENGTVLRYTGYMDMNPEEVYEGVPKYKLVL